MQQINKATIGYGSATSALKDRPIVHPRKNRTLFIKEVIDEATARIKKNVSNTGKLIEGIESTLYEEKLRIKQSSSKVVPSDESVFWEGIQEQLLVLPKTQDKEYLTDKILKSIVTRYAYGIAGNFRPSSYKTARKIATFGFARLLNAARIEKFGAFWRNDLTLHDKIHVFGNVEKIRNLAKKGTIVMVPTNFSNLDPILIGWVINTLGLPAFLYGANYNLFNIGIYAYFMNSLGVYKIDSRKKTSLYTETLNTYSSLALQKDCHSLFFPSGSRSESGKIETNLKTDLMHTVIDAQRANFENNNNKKIFIVPVVLNYHFVLEAPILIKKYLIRKGQERYYVENDKYSNSLNITGFLIQFFTKGSDISVSLGDPMDILGYRVNEAGISFDQQGKPVDIKDYFSLQNKIQEDRQREYVYAKRLNKVVAREYRRISQVFASHIVAFVAFQLFKKRFSKLDIYNLFRLPSDLHKIDYLEFRRAFEIVRNEIFHLYNKKQLDIADHLNNDVDEAISHGLYNIGLYHSKRPLLRNKKGIIVTKDLKTLFYYHNRLTGYDLQKLF